MKYSDGFWMTKPGYNISYATQIYDIETDENSITVYAASNWIANRGMTLGGPMLTIRFSSVMENSIKVEIDHFNSNSLSKPLFKLYQNKSFRPIIEKQANGYKLISGRTTVEIGKIKNQWQAIYQYDNNLLTQNGWRTTSLIEEDIWLNELKNSNNKHRRFYDKPDNSGKTFIREMLNISVGEYIYGFGEKFTSFIKNGQTVKIWNSDGGTCTEQSYKSIPFYVSSKNYGVFVNHPELVTFEVGSEVVSKTAFTIQGEHLEYFIFGGKTISDVLERYTDLTGKPSLPPPYSFGLWLSTSFTTDYDEETVLNFIKEMEYRKIPLEVFHFDCFWMKEFQWCGFEWDNRMFPEPEKFISKLKKHGLKICIWINPYIGQRTKAYKECAEKGYFIKNKDGSIFCTDLWQPGMSIIDFTNSEARQWFAAKVKKLTDMGIDAIKTDFGERIPTDAIYYDGSDPYKMHNYYSYLYNQTVFEVLQEVYGTDRACLFARSATVGCQKFPVHWGGDCFSNYDSMWETLRGGLSLCLSGFGYFSHDISGFEATGSPDLYKRWTAFGLLSTHSRYHGNYSYRVPWNFDEESCDVARHFVNLKGKLMPYIFANAIKTHLTGIPMMRAMIIDFSYDRNTLTLDTQYMLGDSIMVAPVFNEEGECSFYLPEGGIWTDIQSGEELPGGAWYTKKYDYFGLPIYAKPNSIIVFGDFKNSFEYDYCNNMNIVIYGIDNGVTCECKIYNSKGIAEANIKAHRKGECIYLSVTNTQKPFSAHSTQGFKIIMQS